MILKNSVEQEIRSYVLHNLIFGDEPRMPGDQDSFLDKGIIDSTGVLELVAFLQDTFGIQVEDEEIVPENLDTVGNLIRFVQNKSAVTK
ncbi:MAG: acyl carrier protein [Terriglobia bacterium]